MSKKKSSKKWSEKTDKKLIELVNQGVTYRVIAMKLKRSKAAIGARVYYLRQQGVVVFPNKTRGRPVTAHETEPAAVKVAKKVLSKQTENDASWMEKDYKKASPKKNELDVVGNYKLASTKLVVYAEMLEKQVASLKKRLAEIEKIVRD